MCVVLPGDAGSLEPGLSRPDVQQIFPPRTRQADYLLEQQQLAQQLSKAFACGRVPADTAASLCASFPGARFFRQGWHCMTFMDQCTLSYAKYAL